VENSKSAGDFSVDVRLFNEVCRRCHDTGIAYLVLASGTGHDHATTSWSCNSIENYAGFHHKIAKRLVGNIVGWGFAKQTKGGTRPQYKIASWSEFKSAADSKETIANNKAWLSREFISGIAGNASPLVRLRYARDTGLLALAVALYRYRDATAAGHMPPEIVSGSPYDAVPIGGNGPHTIWKFTATEGFELHDREPLKLYSGNGCEAECLFIRLERLIEIGIAYWGPALFDGIEPLSRKLVEFNSDKLCSTTDAVIASHPNEAAQYGLRNRVDNSEIYLVPVESHISQPTIRSVLYLRYLPNTDQTKKWLVDRDLQHRKLENTIASFQRHPPTIALSKAEAA
jgi:hypothetical protein